MGNWLIYFVALLAILIFQLFFSLGLGLITRRISYLYYGGFLVMMGIYNYLRFGAVHQGPLSQTGWLHQLAPIFPFVAYYFYFLFIRFFLRLNGLSPPLNRLARWLEWLSLAYVGIFFLFMEMPPLRTTLYFLLSSVLAIGTLLLQVRLLRFRSTIIRLVQWGSLFYFLGMMTGYWEKLRESLGLPVSTIEVDYMSLGLLIETSFFALALAYQLKQEAQEKQAVQEQALAQLQKIQDLRIALQRVRDEIARDIHDDIGSTLGTISLLSAMAEGQIPADHPAASLVQRMGEYARSSGESMNDAIWALNTRDDTDALVKRMQDFAAVLLTGANLPFEFVLSPAWLHRQFPMLLRKTLYLIFKEALYNLIRHAQATKVTIDLTADPTNLVLSITDNGRGLPAYEVVSGNGLRNMKFRAQEAGIEFHLISPAAGGLQIVLHIPLPTLGEETSPHL